MIQQWQESLELRVRQGELTPELKRTYIWGFAQFMDWLDLQQVQQVNDVLLRRWVESLRAQGHPSLSVEYWIECVWSFFSWATASGLIPLDPTAGISLGRQRPAKPG
jgi:site-specific recombinase XerD